MIPEKQWISELLADDFGSALAALCASPAAVADIRRRFGADQAIEGLSAAARETLRLIARPLRSSRASGVSPPAPSPGT